VVVPHHYYIWDVTTRGSTLLPVDAWIDAQARSRRLETSAVRYARSDLSHDGTRVDFFGEHVAFDKLAWRK
jgi:hypothetical protein